VATQLAQVIPVIGKMTLFMDCFSYLPEGL
jgi:hypothetical protein